MATYDLGAKGANPGQGGDSAHPNLEESAFTASMDWETHGGESNLPLGVSFSFEQGAIAVHPLQDDILLSPQEALLPPGEYWFGDPCYPTAGDSKAWQAWVDLASVTAFGFTEGLTGALYNDLPLLSATTAGGDGVYRDGEGRSYSCDSGGLGPVPGRLVDELGVDREALAQKGTWLTVEEPTRLLCDGSGTISFGPLTIPTA